jgi:DNA-directed RNA polymerase subunit RPC12/RpoP
MDISFKCPICDQELEVDASGAGSTIECPSCSNSITVPNPDPSTVALLAPPPRAAGAAERRKALQRARA